MGRLNGRNLWTSEEYTLLNELYPDNYTIYVSAVLNRSLSSVYGRSKLLGIYKSLVFKKIELSRQADKLRIAGTNSRFKKGQAPANKGKSMSPEVYEKAKKTFYKPGHKPHNTKWDGHERICPKDGYILIRIKEGVYKHKHRVVWENHNGPIPNNMVIRFKDSNKLNIAIDNLEMASKGDIAILNKNNFENLPIELKSLIKTNNKLTKKIKEHEKN